MAIAKKAAASPKEVAVKAEEVKKDVAVKAEVPAKKEADDKEAAKTKSGKKPVAKKEADVKAEAPKKVSEKAAASKTEIHIQFSGKSYSNDDLIKIAKDVWKYDLQQDENNITDLELYVKPEENLVYYVINGEFSGSFGI